MNLEIRSYEGVGPIQLGMTRESVRRSLARPVEQLIKARGSPPIDRLRDPSVMIHYDEKDICEAVEMATPGEPTLLGQPLLGRDFEELRAWFAAHDPDVKVDGDGLISLKLGVGLYAPASPNEPHPPVEGVIVFRRGYYDPPPTA